MDMDINNINSRNITPKRSSVKHLKTTEVFFDEVSLEPASDIPRHCCSWAAQYIISLKVKRFFDEHGTLHGASKVIEAEMREYNSRNLLGSVYIKTIKRAIKISIDMQKKGMNTRYEERYDNDDGTFSFLFRN